MNEQVEIDAEKVAHKSIAAALAAAQAKMGKALKSSSNPHFKSKYADLASVVDACMPSLNEAGIAVIQPTTDDDSGRYVETILIHGESGETLKCRVPLIFQKNDMQGYGSAVTYARRYGLMSMSGIAPEDDDGDAARAAAPDPAKEAEAQHRKAVEDARRAIARESSLESLGELWGSFSREVQADRAVFAAKDARKAELSPPLSENILADEIPY